MKNPNLPTIALAFVALAAANPQPRNAADALSFPVPAGPVEVPAATADGQPASVTDLVEVYAAATAQSFVHAPDDAELAASTPLGLTEALTVPPERLQTVFESLLIERDFVLQVVSTEGPRILSVRSLRTGYRNQVRSRATFVSSERLDTMRAHPAMILTTVVDLPKLDVRQLANSLRTMIVDANTQQLLPAGASSSLVVTAPGGQLATWIETLSLLHEVAPEPAPPGEAEEEAK